MLTYAPRCPDHIPRALREALHHSKDTSCGRCLQTLRESHSSGLRRIRDQHFHVLDGAYGMGRCTRSIRSRRNILLRRAAAFDVGVYLRMDNGQFLLGEDSDQLLQPSKQSKLTQSDDGDGIVLGLLAVIRHAPVTYAGLSSSILFHGK